MLRSYRSYFISVYIYIYIYIWLAHRYHTAWRKRRLRDFFATCLVLSCVCWMLFLSWRIKVPLHSTSLDPWVSSVLHSFQFGEIHSLIANITRLLTLSYKLFWHSGRTLLMVVESEGLKMLYQYIQRWFPIKKKKKKKVKRSKPLIFEGPNILCFV